MESGLQIPIRLIDGLTKMERPPPPRTPSPSPSAALAVLSDQSLLSAVTEFQSGIPLLIHELVVQYQATQTYQPSNLMWRSVMACGDLQAVKMLCRMRSQPQFAHITEIQDANVCRFAMVENRLDVLQWFHESGVEPAPWPSALMANAAFYKHFEMASWLLETRPDACKEDFTKAMERAAVHGCVSLLQQLFAYRPEALTPSVLDVACTYGQWDAIQFLHHDARASCSSLAMDKAAQRGRLDVVRFLHENRTEGCTTNAMVQAAYHGHFEVIKFLHEHRTEGCTSSAMDYAAGRGHLDIVRFLHENRTEGCTTGAIDMAAGSGHLDVIKFLRENRTEGMHNAVVYARDNGYEQVLSYLLGK